MRTAEIGVWAVASLFLVGLIGAAVVGFDVAEIAMVVLFLTIALVAGNLMAGDLDRSWLPTLVVAGFLAKMIGAGLRFYVYRVVYLSQGDAGIYHGAGAQLAQVWRSLSVPSLEGTRGAGTRFLEVIAGFLYTPYTPGLLGGFLIFAMVAFLGQLLFYAAFRRAFPNGRLKLYAIFVLFMPSLVFWPSSIGKDAIMVFFIGLATYGAARLIEHYRFSWIPVLGLGVAGSVAIRPHIGALLVGSVAGAMLLAKGARGAGDRVRKLLLFGLMAAGAVVVIGLFGDRIGLNPEDLELEPYLDEVTRRTNQGGSAVEGDPILTIRDAPQGILRVVFRPLIHEGFSPLALASGIEGTALLALIVWKLPRMVKNAGLLRSRPFLMYSLVYVAGFVVVFSPILNLGILARQRTQMLPLLLALVVVLGWPPPSKRDRPVDGAVTPEELSAAGTSGR